MKESDLVEEQPPRRNEGANPVSIAYQVARLKCMAGKGMFPHEVGVLIRGAERCYESMIDREFVTAQEADSLEDCDVPATLMVNVVKVMGGKLLVELPRQVVSGGRRIWVNQSEVQT